MSKQRSKKYLAIFGLLVILGGIIFIAPAGYSDVQTGNNCGPRAVAALLQETSGRETNGSVTSELVKDELSIWDYIPNEVPLVGGATFPWGIKHALTKMGLSVQVEAGLDAFTTQDVPFIALVLESGGQWHYVAVFEIHKNMVLTNDGLQYTGEFFEKWRWSGYWGCYA